MRALLELVAPDRCVSCGQQARGELCVACAHRVALLDGTRCHRCGDSVERCDCATIAGFRKARSLVVFAEPARSLTLAFKRRARPETIAAMGGLLAALARREELTSDVVAFVPAGRTAKQRGFDHGALLAKAVAAELGARCERLLFRAREGQRQADVPLVRRRENVRGRFEAHPVASDVLLVDDVYTTGATAEACALALRSAGATSVDVVTWARTLRRRSGR